MFNYVSNNNPNPLTSSLPGTLHELEAIFTGVPKPRIFDQDASIPPYEIWDFMAYPLLMASTRVEHWNEKVNCIPVGFACDELLTPAMLIQNSPAVTLGPTDVGGGSVILRSRFHYLKLQSIEVTCYPNASHDFSGEWAMQLLPICTSPTPQHLATNTQILFPGDYMSEPNSLISCEPSPRALAHAPNESEFCGRFQSLSTPIMRFRFSLQIVRDFIEGHGYLRLIPRSLYNFRFTIKSRWLASGHANIIREFYLTSRNYGPYKQAAVKNKNWSGSNDRYHAHSLDDQPFNLWHVNNGEWEFNLFNGFVTKANRVVGPVSLREMDHSVEESEEEDNGFVLLG